MIRLLKIEFLKNLSYKPFKLLSILYFITLIGLLFIGIVDFNLFGSIDFNLKKEGIYNFPQIWNFTTYCVYFFKIVLGMMIIFSVAQEFTNRMLKQNLIDGLSKKEFIASKVLTISVFTFASTFIVFIVSLILGLSYSEQKSTELIFKEIFFVFNYAVGIFSFFTMLLFISILLRKSIIVLLVLFFYWIFEGIASIAEKLLIKFSNPAGYEPSFLVTDLLPFSSFSNLIPSPFLRLNTAKALNISEFSLEYPYTALISSIIWCIVFIFSSYWIIRKRDL